MGHMRLLSVNVYGAHHSMSSAVDGPVFLVGAQRGHRSGCVPQTQVGFESRTGAPGTGFPRLKGSASSVFSNVRMRTDDLPPVMDLNTSYFSG